VSNETVSSRPTLGVIIASTRPGRTGAPIAEWVVQRAEETGKFTVDLIDLAEVNLPFMDEPNHPRLQKYTKPHTKAWSQRIAATDAFVFVMPEYNHGIVAPLKNALDFLHHEWQYKPVGLVSYGAVSAGLRAVQMIRQILPTFRMVPIAEGVPIPNVGQFMKDGALEPNQLMEDAATVMLNELAVWEKSLRSQRLARD